MADEAEVADQRARGLRRLERAPAHGEQPHRAAPGERPGVEGHVLEDEVVVLAPLAPPRVGEGVAVEPVAAAEALAVDRGGGLEALAHHPVRGQLAEQPRSEVALGLGVEDQTGGAAERGLHRGEAGVGLVVEAGDDQAAVGPHRRSQHRAGEQVGGEEERVDPRRGGGDRLEQRLAHPGVLDPGALALGAEAQPRVEHRLLAGGERVVAGAGHRKAAHPDPGDVHVRADGQAGDGLPAVLDPYAGWDGVVVGGRITKRLD